MSQQKIAEIEPLGIWTGTAGNQRPANRVEVSGVQAARGSWFFGYKPKTEGEVAFRFYFNGEMLENVNPVVFGEDSQQRVDRDLYIPVAFRVPHKVCISPGISSIVVKCGFVDEVDEEFISTQEWQGVIVITEPVMEE